MKYLTYSGNNLVRAELPAGATVYYPPASLPGIQRPDIPAAVRRALENPLGMPPLRELVGPRSKVLIAFDDNCQPFPPMRQPDIREIVVGTVLELLDACGVPRQNVQLRCAVALHRKMKDHELEYMLGERIFREFHPHRLANFDAEDPEDVVAVEIGRAHV